MANNIQVLISAGHDSFVQLYDVLIDLPTNVKNGTLFDIVDANFRNDKFQGKVITRIGNFQPPESSLGEYPIYYQSGSIVRQNAKIELNRKISLPFRIDANYDIYRVLKAWQGLYLGTSQADYRLPNLIDDEAYFGIITIKGYNSDTTTDFPVSGNLTTEATWVFEKVMCVSVSEPQFGRDAANPVEVTAEFLYFYVTPPTYPADSTPTKLAVIV